MTSRTRPQPLQHETFSAWRITDLGMQDAVPELLGDEASLDEALALGANLQPGSYFYVLHIDHRRPVSRGQAFRKFYRVGQTSKGGLTRMALDGSGLQVAQKARAVTFLFDLGGV